MKTYFFINDLNECDSWFGDQNPVCSDAATIRQICDDEEEWRECWHDASMDEINRYGLFDDDAQMFGALPTRAFVDGVLIDVDDDLTPEQIADEHGNGDDIIIWMDGETNKPSSHRFAYDENVGRYEPKPSGELLVLAEEIQNDDIWDFAKLRKLCECAGMSAEWEDADHEMFQTVALAAAEKLGVEIQE